MNRPFHPTALDISQKLPTGQRGGPSGINLLTSKLYFHLELWTDLNDPVTKPIKYSSFKNYVSNDKYKFELHSNDFLNQNI